MKRWLPILLMLACVGIASAQGTDGPATLPTLFATPFPNTTGYTQVTVCASMCTYSSVATALASVSCGTVIKITAGQSFQGAVNANQTCTSSTWIVVLSSDCTFAGSCTHIGAQGNRIATNPSGIAVISPYMASITGPNSNNTSTINISVSGSGAAYYWFGPGLIITGPADGVEFDQGGTIQDDQTAGAYANINHIVFDRDWVTCAAGQDCVRQWAFGGSYEAGVDSIFNQAHSLQSDQSQAVWEDEGYGPFKIVNNYLGGSSEPFLAGGGSCPPGSVIPTGFEIAGNYIVYDFGSRASTFLNSTYGGNVRAIMELKEGEQYQIQGNVLDASAVAGLNNTYILNIGFLSRTANQPGSCTHITTQDVTFRFNESLHSAAALALQGGNAGFVTAGFFNQSIHDNLFDDENSSNGGQTEDSIVVDSFASPKTYNVLINHNTIIASNGVNSSNTWGYMNCGAGSSIMLPSFTMTNNIAMEGMYGMGAYVSNSYIAGTTGLNGCMSGGASGYTWTGNMAIGVNQSETWPAGNFMPTTTGAVGFTNFNSGNGGNYQLTNGSSYHNAGTDGKDIGVSNYSCLNTLIALATNGTYTEAGASCANTANNTPPAPSRAGLLLARGQ